MMGAAERNLWYVKWVLYRLRWVLIACGVVSVLAGGASIFSQPEYETLYGPEPPLVNCSEHGCVALYTLTVGNSGWREQENVSVRLHAAALQQEILKPRVSNFGVVPRPVRISESEPFRTYELGRLKPRDRVRMNFTLRCASRSTAPSWADLLAEVRAAQGEARAGDAAVVAAGRTFFSVTGCAGLLD